MYNHGISIILTTFNGEKYIKKQIDSILNQTLLPYEVVICDDRSTDKTCSLLEAYAENKLIKLYINDERLGIVKNFQKAAKLVTANNYIAFADQDDIWAADKLQTLVNEISVIDDETTPSLVYSDLKVVDKNDAIIAGSFWDKQQIKPDSINLKRLLYGNMVTGCTMIINSSMKQEFLLIDNYDFLHDEWLALIAYSFGKVAFTPNKLVLYRQHESNVTYAEGKKEPGIWNKLYCNLQYFFKQRRFLEHQFNMASAFLLKYENKLNSDQLIILKKFIILRERNYLIQRIYRRYFTN